MACDICGKTGCYLSDVREIYQTDMVKQVCSQCGADLDNFVNKVRGISSKMQIALVKNAIEQLAPSEKPLGQSKVASFAESAVNVVVGFAIALVSQLIIFPLYGIHIPLSTDIAIVCWFTLVSLLRGYIVRRWFNNKTFKE